MWIKIAINHVESTYLLLFLNYKRCDFVAHTPNKVLRLPVFNEHAMTIKLVLMNTGLADPQYS